MNQTTLPVIILKNIILFPSGEIRLELENESDKEILNLAETYYEKHILIVHQTDILEKNIDLNDLPNIGVLGYIEMKIDLPNKKTRVVIRGLNRVKIENYKQEDNTIVADIKSINCEKLDKVEELAYIRSLVKQFEYYIDNNPSMSNSILSKIRNLTDLDRLTDIVCISMHHSYDRKMEYINEINPTVRTTMLLEDINTELKIVTLEKQIEEKVSKNIEKQQKEYILQEKLKAIKEELGTSFDKDFEVNELKIKIAKSKCPKNIKDKLFKELDHFSITPITSPEIGIIRNYIDLMLDLPYVSTTDNKNLEIAKKILDETHYGLDDVKSRIIEYLALRIFSKKENGQVLCLVGPPGVGKTTLAKSIARATCKNYAKISVGGVNDEAEIMGHRRTYVGASPGRIINGMIKAKSNNPVFVIDEIDKLCKDIKGDPSSSLLEVLDKEQNKTFTDNYVGEPYDLSKVMFICTANYIENIPVELLDRLEIIEINSYTEKEKLLIAKNHLIKKIISNLGVDPDMLKFTDKAILKIIRSYTKESGVRDLERKIESIVRKIITEIVFDKKDKKYLITEKEVEKYLKLERYLENDFCYDGIVGVSNGMAYTSFGGDILPIEISIYKGKGDIVATGYLGEIFIESVKTSIGYIKSNALKLSINPSIFEKNDIHIHIPEGAVKKDGPSAGIAITTAIISEIKNIEIPKNIAMTGEITLKGKVLPIGGLKEKIIGVKKYGVNKIFLPKSNEKELLNLDKDITKDIEFILVSNYSEVIDNLNFNFKTKDNKILIHN
ncbi:MAG: endopeptidase La [bacterium]|nr:endopeptidase La [bacterium]